MKTEAEIRFIRLKARKVQSYRNWKNQGKILPLGLQREQGLADTIILDFWLPEV